MAESHQGKGIAWGVGVAFVEMTTKIFELAVYSCVFAYISIAAENVGTCRKTSIERSSNYTELFVCNDMVYVFMLNGLKCFSSTDRNNYHLSHAVNET